MKNILDKIEKVKNSQTKKIIDSRLKEFEKIYKNQNKDEIFSEAMTSAFLYMPLTIYCLAVIKAKRKPAHAALTSKAVAFLAPSAFCTRHATDGKLLSGLIVATMIRSSFAGSKSADFNACFAAFVAKWLLRSPLAAMRRSLIPVRVVIHSSLVSTIFSRSKLVKTFSGTKLPTEMIPTFFIPHSKFLSASL